MADLPDPSKFFLDKPIDLAPTPPPAKPLVAPNGVPLNIHVPGPRIVEPYMSTVVASDPSTTVTLTGSKIFIIARNEKVFDAFRQIQQGKHMFYLPDGEAIDQLRRTHNSRADIVFLGAFWMRADFPLIREHLEGFYRTNPKLAFTWFPADAE